MVEDDTTAEAEPPDTQDAATEAEPPDTDATAEAEPPDAEAEAEPPDAEAEAEPPDTADAAPEADSGDDDDEIDPAVLEHIGQDTTVVHDLDSHDEHGMPTNMRTGPGIPSGLDPGSLADRDRGPIPPD